MEHYLDIAQVDSKGSLGRLFLSNMMIWKIYLFDIWCYWYMNVAYYDEYVICLYCHMKWWLIMLQVIWSKVVLIVSYHIYLFLWGYWASHDHCTCRLGMGSLLSVFYVMFIWFHIYELLTWLYDHVWYQWNFYLLYVIWYLHWRFLYALACFRKIW